MFQILIVEDDADLNYTVCSFLNQSGYKATDCQSAEDAYDMMYSKVFDIIISDIMMQGTDGFEFAENVRRINEDIPILFMTARDDIASKQLGFRIGIDDYMVKPIDLDELFLRIGALLRRAKIASSRRLEVGNLVLDADEHTAYEEEENLICIGQMRSAGLQDKTFYGYTFEKCDAAQENAVYARRYVEHFSEMAQKGQGLLSWGNVGTGKTFLAGCIANAILEQKIYVSSEKKKEYTDQLANYISNISSTNNKEIGTIREVVARKDVGDRYRTILSATLAMMSMIITIFASLFIPMRDSEPIFQNVFDKEWYMLFVIMMATLLATVPLMCTVMLKELKKKRNQREEGHIYEIKTTENNNYVKETGKT